LIRSRKSKASSEPKVIRFPPSPAHARHREDIG
jgi:hypothetical protein